MKIKLIIAAVALIIIILLALSGTKFKYFLINKLGAENPSINCDERGICTSCIIEGSLCSCDKEKCICGDKIVDSNECILG